MICLTAGAVVATLTVQSFTLSWMHSVQKTEIQEDYRLDAGRMVLTDARIQSSGAGFDPPPDAVLDDGWWRWHPGIQLDGLTLARAAAPGDWRICLDNTCRPLSHLIADAADDIPVRIAACATER